jgi:hypothetical protein
MNRKASAARPSRDHHGAAPRGNRRRWLGWDWLRASGYALALRQPHPNQILILIDGVLQRRTERRKNDLEVAS